MPELPPDDGRPLTSGQVAELFGVHASTVIEWADSGKLPHFRTPSGQRRFRPSTIRAFLETETPSA